ncbi:glycosyltransferase [Erythrobacter sp. MTPC3]|uniref:glycosyltransferase n=1 Tax=Erythrobacter sp. MTPC3 TaxID=3056564 RepID=UPI0036F3CAC7
MKVVHVSGDFPDTIASFKTPVIKTLVDLTNQDFAHEVFSINRSPTGAFGLSVATLRGNGWPRLTVSSEPFEYGLAISYNAPGRGIFHKSMLDQLGRALANHVISRGEKPDLIIGHKLTIEGLIVSAMSKALGVPYALSIQGDTDTKILQVRRDLKGTFRKIWREARVIFPFSPWSYEAIRSSLGEPGGSVVMLPCATDLDEPMRPVAKGDGLVSVFHLKNWRRKNLNGIAQAVRTMSVNGNAPTVSIIGGGDAKERDACKAIIGDVPGITLVGAVNHPHLKTRMNAATAFILPSRRESFGMVFIEALFAGLPIIYPKGTAVDGYFDNAPFALSVDANSPASIASAMQDTIDNEKSLKRTLAEWQCSADAKRFTRAEIGKTFAKSISGALGGKS